MGSCSFPIKATRPCQHHESSSLSLCCVVCWFLWRIYLQIVLLEDPHEMSVRVCQKKVQQQCMAINILVMNEHIDYSFPYRNRFKHMPLNTMLWCNHSPCSVFHAKTINDPTAVCNRYQKPYSELSTRLHLSIPAYLETLNDRFSLHWGYRGFLTQNSDFRTENFGF